MRTITRYKIGNDYYYPTDTIMIGTARWPMAQVLKTPSLQQSSGLVEEEHEIPDQPLQEPNESAVTTKLLRAATIDERIGNLEVMSSFIAKPPSTQDETDLYTKSVQFCNYSKTLQLLAEQAKVSGVPLDEAALPDFDPNLEQSQAGPVLWPFKDLTAQTSTSASIWNAGYVVGHDPSSEYGSTPLGTVIAVHVSTKASVAEAFVYLFETNAGGQFLQKETASQTKRDEANRITTFTLSNPITVTAGTQMLAIDANSNFIGVSPAWDGRISRYSRNKETVHLQANRSCHFSFEYSE